MTETEAPREPVDTLSIQERTQRRIAAKQAHRTEVLPVDGYEDIFAARYRAISYEELRDIGERNAEIAKAVDREIATAADILARACEEVFEVKADGTHESLGSGWSAPLAAKLALPNVTTGRQCLLAIFVDHLDLIAHRNSYIAWRDEAVIETASETVGKSES